jgi:hypothetical protein
LRPHRFTADLQRRLQAVHAVPFVALDEAVASALRRIAERPAMTGLEKGAPDTAEMLRQRALRSLALLPSLSQDAQAGRELLRLTRWMAASDARDAEAFVAYGLAFRLVHRPLLQQLQSRLTACVVLHMSCAPRLARAGASAESFLPVEAQGVSQLTVVGAGRDQVRFEWDDRRGVLLVPADDSYDHLAAKVASAYCLLAFVPGVRAVLKVDDDHRLASGQRLVRALAKAASAARPTQWGHFYRARYYGGHTRLWHAGKCGQAPINQEPYGYMGALTWCTGEQGYLLNRPALDRLLWAWIYFEKMIETALYEDAFVSDTLVRLGGRLRMQGMTRFLHATSAY